MYRRVIKNKTSINLTRLALVCIFPISILLSVLGLINKMVQNLDKDSVAKQATTASPSIAEPFPIPKTTMQAPVNPKDNPILQSNDVNKNNNHSREINMLVIKQQFWEIQQTLAQV